MREGKALITFTARGTALAERLAAALGGSVSRAGEGAESLAAWTAAQFPAREALIFVGAAGIAVRAVAPHLRGKAEDPAVVCVDETGRWAVPILSGHLGGANALARSIAALTGGEAVLTTATDLGGVFAVDLWAKQQGMTVRQPERIKRVSAKLLRGEAIRIDCPWPVAGTPPERVSTGSGGEVRVSYRTGAGEALHLIPRVLTLGIGCRRGVEHTRLEEVFARFCAERGILPQAIEGAATIALKRDEAGLLGFCAGHGWPLALCEAERLRALPGDFTASAFVARRVGVDNVCERAALMTAGGRLIERKFAAEGVTFALAERPPKLDWSW